MRTLLYEKILSDCFFLLLLLPIVLYIMSFLYVIRLLHKTLWRIVLSCVVVMIVLLIYMLKGCYFNLCFSNE